MNVYWSLSSLAMKRVRRLPRLCLQILLPTQPTPRQSRSCPVASPVQQLHAENANKWTSDRSLKTISHLIETSLRSGAVSHLVGKDSRIASSFSRSRQRGLAPLRSVKGTERAHRSSWPRSRGTRSELATGILSQRSCLELVAVSNLSVHILL